MALSKGHGEEARGPRCPRAGLPPRRDRELNHPGELHQGSRHFVVLELLPGRLSAYMVFRPGHRVSSQLPPAITRSSITSPPSSRRPAASSRRILLAHLYSWSGQRRHTFVAHLVCIDRLGPSRSLSTGSHRHDLVAADHFLGVSREQLSPEPLGSAIQRLLIAILPILPPSSAISLGPECVCCWSQNLSE